MFRQVKQNRAFEEVLSQIQEAILEGGFKAGEKLPSERQLQEMFSVSRGTLREAFRVLEQKGLIRIRKGTRGGAFVCSMDTKGVSESIDLLLRYQKISMKELTEFREDVEGLMVEKAAKKATKENINELRFYLDSIKEEIQVGLSGWGKIVELDKSFHLTLVRIVNNRMYESVLHSVYDNINSYLEEFLPKNVAVLRNNYKELYRITKAIENRDPERARFYFKQHVRPYYKRIEMNGTSKTISEGTGASFKRVRNAKSGSKK
jgi:GntR family transcriptional regulator, transcriptional repressor for pyruvate dehydrogenase complex